MSMTFDEYQEESRRTRNPLLAGWAISMEAALGLAGETGEVVDLIKKHQCQGHDLDVSGLIEEMGDVLWYLSEMADYLGVSLDDVAAGNVKKLRIRYPNGFTAEQSRERTAE